MARNHRETDTGGLMAFVIFSTKKAVAEALEALKPFEPLSYYSLIRRTGQGVYEIPEYHFPKLEHIRGWRKLRAPHDDLRVQKTNKMNPVV